MHRHEHTPHVSHVCPITDTLHTHITHMYTYHTPNTLHTSHTQSKACFGKASCQNKSSSGQVDCPRPPPPPPSPTCSLQALAVSHSTPERAYLTGEPPGSQSPISPGLCPGKPSSRSSRHGYPRGCWQESPETWEKQGWSGGLATNTAPAQLLCHLV